MRFGRRPDFRFESFPIRIARSAQYGKGLIKVEKDHLRERLRLWTEHLRDIGVTGLFGGIGEQTGFGEAQPTPSADRA